jgi:hypothetical protein
MVLVRCDVLQVMTAKKRYEVGLSRLATTESSVTGMQVSYAPRTNIAAEQLNSVCMLFE